jgi:FkbM family methyltransferase
MKYYSLSGEDSAIEKYFEKDHIGGCIDIGASDGINRSNTKHFEELGWYCLCIEPNPRYFNELIINRKNAINFAISDIIGDLKFTVVSLGNNCEDAGSSLKVDLRLLEQFMKYNWHISIKPILVSAITLDYCIEQYYKYDKIDFISIDTEGTELDILKSFSIEKWNPKLLVIENNFNDPDIEIYLDLYGYTKDQRIEVNDFYIKSK